MHDVSVLFCRYFPIFFRIAFFGTTKKAPLSKRTYIAEGKWDKTRLHAFFLYGDVCAPAAHAFPSL